MTLCLIIVDWRDDPESVSTTPREYAIKKVGAERYREAELVILIKDLKIMSSPEIKNKPVAGVLGRIIKGEAGMAPCDIEMEVIT